MSQKLSQDMNMPTASRLVAAASLSVCSIMMVFVLIYFYPDERFDKDLSGLMWVFGICGAIVGWKSMGRRIMVEGGTGIFLGLRAAATTTIFIVVILGINYMRIEIGKGNLIGGGAMDGVFVAMNKSIEYLQFLLHPKVAGIGLFLGVCSGVMTRNAYHRWA